MFDFVFEGEGSVIRQKMETPMCSHAHFQQGPGFLQGSSLSVYLFVVMASRHFTEDSAGNKPTMRIFGKLSHKQALFPQEFGFQRIANWLLPGCFISLSWMSNLPEAPRTL